MRGVAVPLPAGGGAGGGGGGEARSWAGGGFEAFVAGHGLGLDGVGRSAHIHMRAH
jgi:hypothetical protein